MQMGQGPLSGVKILEFAGIGPAPLAGMLFADLGADVLRIDRAGETGPRLTDPKGRGKHTLALNLKSADDLETALKLIEAADALIEGFRPGVMERLGLGPQQALKRNPKLVYGRMTGWGQEGPLAHTAGHDINYIALTGALHAIGRRGEPPPPPLNLIGDYAGGAMFLAFGVLAGMLSARSTGRGQVVDAAMVDGVAALMALFHGMKADGLWSSEREDNLLDGAAHFYDTYECADGQWLAVGAIEPQFHALLVKGLGFSEADFPGRMDRANWPAHSERIAARIREKTRDEWMAIFEGTDACVAPVLSMDEAPNHPHIKARGTLARVGGRLQAAPAPRFSLTPSASTTDLRDVARADMDRLKAWGLAHEKAAALAK
jgi:alpha-methylacyl-CoA racemase